GKTACPEMVRPDVMPESAAERHAIDLGLIKNGVLCYERYIAYINDLPLALTSEVEKSVSQTRRTELESEWSDFKDAKISEVRVKMEKLRQLEQLFGITDMPLAPGRQP